MESLTRSHFMAEFEPGSDSWHHLCQPHGDEIGVRPPGLKTLTLTHSCYVTFVTGLCLCFFSISWGTTTISSQSYHVGSTK